MNTLETTILSLEQMTGYSKLEIFRKRGNKASITDYAILCGGFASVHDYVGDKHTPENRTGWYWTSTVNGGNNVCAIGLDGYIGSSLMVSRSGGIRLVLPFSTISNTCFPLKIAEDGILEMRYGEYPQMVVSKQIQEKLENLYQKQALYKTKKYYTRDIVPYNWYGQKFQAEILEEYEYQGKKYVRVKANGYGSNCTLSNGVTYQYGNYIWIEVQPIQWLVDQKENIAVTEKLLFSGVQFKNNGYYEENFESTDLGYYIHHYLSKEIISSSPISYSNNTLSSLQKVYKIENPL